MGFKLCFRIGDGADVRCLSGKLTSYARAQNMLAKLGIEDGYGNKHARILFGGQECFSKYCSSENL